MTLWDKIKLLVTKREANGVDTYDMKQLLEDALQETIFEGSELTAQEVAARAISGDTMKKLGVERRNLLRQTLGALILDIASFPTNHNMEFKYTCRLIGLFISTKYTGSWTRTAEVSPDGICVIQYGPHYTVQCKYAMIGPMEILRCLKGSTWNNIIELLIT
ncbi:uncharacterized protein LOC126835814 [Adelges cooleyi]|uniref:uncharacterized protein LOC126835814 n=1 Tax=Adelges cooleyi TaxID=133065 RepID=UPI002180088F|nr:uncharacterized protein LOC126835814 [Adelges cooleyi]